MCRNLAFFSWSKEPNFPQIQVVPCATERLYLHPITWQTRFPHFKWSPYGLLGPISGTCRAQGGCPNFHCSPLLFYIVAPSSIGTLGQTLGCILSFGKNAWLHGKMALYSMKKRWRGDSALSSCPPLCLKISPRYVFGSEIQFYLVGGLKHFSFFHILGIILPFD